MGPPALHWPSSWAPCHDAKGGTCGHPRSSSNGSNLHLICEANSVSSQKGRKNVLAKIFLVSKALWQLSRSIIGLLERQSVSLRNVLHDMLKASCWAEKCHFFEPQRLCDASKAVGPTFLWQCLWVNRSSLDNLHHQLINSSIFYVKETSTEDAPRSWD